MVRALSFGWIGVFPALVSLLAPSPASASDEVIVRTYNTYGMPHHVVRSASETVRRLFSDAGIAARWRDCRVVGRRPRSDTDPCSDSVMPNEVIVRLVGGRGAIPMNATVSLGDAFIDPMTKAGSLATIYVDRVSIIARALQIDFGTMVGRAITHEIAHLLLGTNQHSGRGLMRGTWRTTMVTNSEDDWLFTPEQQNAMRAAVGLRSPQHNTTASSPLRFSPSSLVLGP